MVTQNNIDELFKALRAGERAYHDGMKIKDNPHRTFSELWERWQRGFANARLMDAQRKK